MKVLKWLDESFEEVLLMIMLFLISIVMGYSVFMRYVMNDSPSWAEEITRYFFVWSSFLSLSFCLKRKSSIKIDMLLVHLPRWAQKLNLAIIEIVMLVFFVYMLQGAVNVTVGMIRSGQSSPALELPMYAIYGSAAVGFFLAIIRTLQNFFGLFFRSPGKKAA